VCIVSIEIRVDIVCLYACSLASRLQTWHVCGTGQHLLAELLSIAWHVMAGH